MNRVPPSPESSPEIPVGGTFVTPAATRHPPPPWVGSFQGPRRVAGHTAPAHRVFFEFRNNHFHFQNRGHAVKTSDDDETTIERLAEIVDVTPRWVRKHIESGTITRVGRGKVSLKQAVRALIADAKRNPDQDRDAAERAALNAARRRVAEARLAEIEGRVMEVAEVEAIVDEFVAVVRTEFDTFAGRVAGLDWSLRKKIDEERFKSLTRISDHFAKVANEIEKRNRKNERKTVDD